MRDKQILGALAMDLKRVALGYYRGSNIMADRFYLEALKRRDEINKKNLEPYLIRFLYEIDNLGKEEKTKAAEDALLYSTIFQNAAVS